MSMKMLMAPTFHGQLDNHLFGLVSPERDGAGCSSFSAAAAVPDPNDDKVLEAAVNGQADALDQVYEFPLLTVRLHL